MESNSGSTFLDKNDSLLSNKSFPFETESMTIRGNVDYIKLVEYLVMLESLRTQSLKDIEQLMALKDEYMNDPLMFLQRVEAGEDLGIPKRFSVPEMPNIDWGKYKATPFIDDFRPATRAKYQPVSAKSETEEEKVRGRVKRSDKPQSYNQLWTQEEQTHLERLLIKYPPEENEARRFAKIAEELGTRTLAQVTSRCQKFFIKLQKAGLPIPGRAPKIRSNDYRSSRAKMNPFFLTSSTFFPRTNPPVPFRDDGDLPGTSTISTSHIKVEPEEPLSPDGQLSDDSQKLFLIRRVRNELCKLSEKEATIKNVGYSCNVCNEEPILGIRWHCVSCGEEDSVDFCSDCLINQLDATCPHPLDHHFVACRPRIGCNTWDSDYTYHGEHYNYLDPNFQPD